MAPEQCQDAGHVDAKVDVYALGVLLYELLTGQPPFAAASSVELMMLQLKATPRPIKELLPTVPDGLAALLHQLLAKAAVARPAMSEVAERLLPLAQPTARAEDPPAPRQSLAPAVTATGRQPATVAERPGSTFASMAGESSVHPRPRPRHRAVLLYAVLGLGTAAAGLLAMRSVGEPKRAAVALAPAARSVGEPKRAAVALTPAAQPVLAAPESPADAGISDSATLAAVTSTAPPAAVIVTPAAPPAAVVVTPAALPAAAVVTLAVPPAAVVMPLLLKGPQPALGHSPATPPPRPGHSDRPPIRFRDKDPDAP